MFKNATKYDMSNRELGVISRRQTLLKKQGNLVCGVAGTNMKRSIDGMSIHKYIRKNHKMLLKMVDPSLGSWQFKPVKEFLISKIEGSIDPTQIQRSINKTLRPLADPKQLSTKHSGRFGEHSTKNKAK